MLRRIYPRAWLLEARCVPFCWRYNIRIYKTPITPVSLANGKMLYERNCYVCHGMKGGGDGPLAVHFDPSPAVLSNPKITGDAETNAYDNFEVIVSSSIL